MIFGISDLVEELYDILEYKPKNLSQNESTRTRENAAMGIRTPVEGVRVLHDWPVYTIAADLLITWHARRFKYICPWEESPGRPGSLCERAKGCADLSPVLRPTPILHSLPYE
jgi:hypothetical protein